MARRATSLTNKRTAAREKTPADFPEQIAAKTPRRGKGAKLPNAPPTEMSVADAFFPGGEELAASVADAGLNEPTKSRRGRKPKAQPAPDILTTEDDSTHATRSPAKDNEPDPGDVSSEIIVDSTAIPPEPPARKRRGRQATVVEQPSSSTIEIEPAPSAPHSSAVRWDAATGTATFDWPSIEQVAATGGPNQAMAKLLLAARAEGANSRWPF